MVGNEGLEVEEELKVEEMKFRWSLTKRDSVLLKSLPKVERAVGLECDKCSRVSEYERGRKAKKGKFATSFQDSLNDIVEDRFDLGTRAKEARALSQPTSTRFCGIERFKSLRIQATIH